jgi:hypothetical protein
MRTIETTATISEDRKLVLQLPLDVTPGEHRVRVVLDEPAIDENTSSDTPLRWEKGVLVYGGEVAGPTETAIADSREERMRHVLAGYQP